jgi:hypothetical protein
MTNATIDVPTKVADQYSHRFPNIPESNAGANERAGFIDAPEINAKKKISRPPIPPIAIPPKRLNPLVYTTMKITAIRRADASTSIPKVIGIEKSNLAHLHLGLH